MKKDTANNRSNVSRSPSDTAAAASNPEIVRDPGIPFVEFVTIIAMIMALNALAIDVMLPALPAIGDALNIAEDNDRQLILLSYLIGFGGAQLFFGPITDAIGRKSVLVGGLALYSLASIAAIFASDVDQLLLARLVQGIGCAGARVTALSVVRDCYTGRRMGKVMSLVMMVFMSVPVIAPSIGQGVLIIAGWHWIFTLLLFAGISMLVWCALRLPETLPAEKRRPMVLANIVSAYMTVFKTRTSLGYTVGTAFVFGGLFAFLAMSQQIFVDIFDLGALFPLVFAAIAITMAAASFMNAQLVEAIGMRRLSHIATLCYTGLGVVIFVISAAGLETFWLFLALNAVIMMTFGFVGANFNAMAMEPLGDIAGTASSVIGFISTLGGALLGYAMGQQFNGSTQPLGLAFALYGLAALGCILYAEKGRMFHALDRETPEKD
ncbi:multidrug effflux MFS transporter [Roseibium denhamense]|uniref:Bcr/CflA family efflux transporter n=1 Tax=Roseibium denhamense TaxID=76305 RepID=A0ABY1NF47_9HYPH|nr:multidrug effflux MFS transporter [Roseibium denhamense]SMP08016.1 MFS transporter, DHA1 family, bicyclomycin/chloramphenicol resistance protein [Roseibium denhamense]